MNTYLYKAKLSKRVGAGIIDIFIMFTLFAMFFSFIFSPIFSSLTKIDYYENKITEMKIDSHLYIADKKEIYVPITEKYDENITLFYLEFDYTDIDQNEKVDYLGNYLSAKEESGLFTYSEETGWIEKTGVEEDLVDFYDKQWEIADDLLNLSKHLNGYSYRMIMLRIAVIVTSLIVTYLAYHLLLPLFLKDGQTLGKVVCGLKVVDQKGFRVKYPRMVLRCFVGLFFNVLLAIIFGLPWFVSITMLIFSKNAITIQDYFSVTYIVDARLSTMFSSKAELDEFEKKMKNKEYKYVHEKGY